MMTIRWRLDDSELAVCLLDDTGADVACSDYTMGAPQQTWSEDGRTAAESVDEWVCGVLGVDTLDGLDVTIEAP